MEEVNDHCADLSRARGGRCRTLSFFDPRHHAASVVATTLLTVGDPGAPGGPEWLAPLSASLGDRVEHYAFTHEGGADGDRLDAWLAERMGVAPKPRLWEAAR